MPEPRPCCLRQSPPQLLAPGSRRVLDPGAAPRAGGLPAVTSAGSAPWEATLNAPRSSTHCSPSSSRGPSTRGSREQLPECTGDSFTRAFTPQRFIEFLLCAWRYAMDPDGRESQDRPVPELSGPRGHREAGVGLALCAGKGRPPPPSGGASLPPSVQQGGRRRSHRKLLPVPRCCELE